MNWVSAHVRYLQRQNAWRFFAWVMVEKLFFGLLVALLARLALYQPPRTPLFSGPILKVYFTVVFFGPLVETTLFQWGTIEVVRKCGGKPWVQMAFSMALFGAAHFAAVGMVTGLSAGIVGGSFLAFTYITWRSASRRRAFLMTWGLHMTYNFILTSARFLHHRH